MSTHERVIEIADLSMSFGDQKVIDGLSFEVNKGEIFGLLGSNGSGKTTTLRCLFGMLNPQHGKLLVNGKPWSTKMASSLGYLPEERGLYTKETVTDVMTFFGRLKGMQTKDAQRWINDYLERVDLADAAHKKVEKLSGGMQQKIQLGVTIMNEPEILVLDEPTKGLDPVNRQLLNEIIEDHHQRGATIVLITHQMEQVEQVCDRVLLLKDGNAAAYGTVQDVRRQFGGQRVRVTHHGPLPPLPGVTQITTRLGEDGEDTELQIDDYVSLPDVLDAYVRNRVQIRSFTPFLSSMNDVFISVYGAESA
ncbi:ABC transporter ATP-binding protein [Stomatohabitans albus]|uniref:ABC transporter ATP-binding protein n=1 Tax=Stomatohabitans albus TaxID=3110766 RepID=UPI00300D2A1F